MNFHLRADSRALFEKYLLGPAEVSLASVTFPAESTPTRTTTRIFPVMVLSAPCETLGCTRCATAPAPVPFCVAAPELGVAAGVVCADSTGVGCGDCERELKAITIPAIKTSAAIGIPMRFKPPPCVVLTALSVGRISVERSSVGRTSGGTCLVLTQFLICSNVYRSLGFGRRHSRAMRRKGSGTEAGIRVNCCSEGWPLVSGAKAATNNAPMPRTSAATVESVLLEGRIGSGRLVVAASSIFPKKRRNRWGSSRDASMRGRQSMAEAFARLRPQRERATGVLAQGSPPQVP